MVLQFLFFIYFAFSRICSPEEELVTFSQCLNNSITALYNWKFLDCENSNHPPIYNISCKIECPPGKYLGIDKYYHPDCLDCPHNTYSTGEIIRFSEHDYNFDQAIKLFETNCQWADSF